MSRASRLLRPALVAALSVFAPAAFAQQTGVGVPQDPVAPDALPPIPEVRELLATVNATPIYADEIEPLEIVKQSRPEAPGSSGFNAWLDSVRQTTFQHRAITLLQARITEEAVLLPTEAEIAAVRAFRARQQQARLLELIAMRDGLERDVAMQRTAGQEPPNEVLAELRRLRSEAEQMQRVLDGRKPKTQDGMVIMEAADRQFATSAVQSWKFAQYLHEKYGGKVLVRGASVEPVEAYLALFAEEEEAGRLVFETDWARRALVGAYESTRPTLVDPVPDAFNVPWWNSDLPPQAQ